MHRACRNVAPQLPEYCDLIYGVSAVSECMVMADVGT